MKNNFLILAATSLLILSACKDADNTKETPAEIKDSVVQKLEEVTQTEAPMDSAAQMKAWMDYMTPNEMHKFLAASNGKWDGQETTWESATATPMGPHKITAEYKMILGDRYQDGAIKGNMMGMPFEGRSIMAYDNAKKKFTNIWADNMGTGIFYSEGTYDEKTKSMTMTGKMMDPSKGKEMEVRQVTTFTDDKHQTMEMFCTGADGKEFKNMEIVFTKK